MSFIGAAMLILTSPHGTAEPGFHSARDKEVPSAVRATAKSVVRIELPEKFSECELFDASQARDRYALAKSSSDFLRVGVGYQAYEARRPFCVGAETESMMTGGSGVIVHGGNAIWTNFHVIAGFVRAVEKAAHARYPDLKPEELYTIVKSQPIPLVVYDSTGNIIYYPTTKSPAPYLVYDYEESGSIDHYPYFSSLYDWVEIRFDNQIGRPVKLSSRTPRVGDPLYGAGFPEKTTSRKRMGKKDANGRSFYFTLGKTLEPMDLPGNLNSANTLLKRALIDSDVDGHTGMSGGPFFSESGELVGLIRGGSVKTDNSPGENFAPRSFGPSARWILQHLPNFGPQYEGEDPTCQAFLLFDSRKTTSK